MRFSPLLPARRPLFGRRLTTIEPELAGPTREERRLIDRLLRRRKPADPA